ncbi:MAG: hypothetical protein OXQ31_03990 [Spirochaetaceae bacterium]|nr:hypothetical protein [Rhodospirillaceae bacterium]MDD9985413.1 hypothetical protein [Spirochaetaceae bacterium]
MDVGWRDVYRRYETRRLERELMFANDEVAGIDELMRVSSARQLPRVKMRVKIRRAAIRAELAHRLSLD